jgi:LPXTG-motif cell wall-anchored protein
VIKRVVMAVAAVTALVSLALPAGADNYPPSHQGGTPVTVEAPTTAEEPYNGDLPQTGDDTSVAMARVAAGMVAAGGVLVLVARRRRASLA